MKKIIGLFLVILFLINSQVLAQTTSTPAAETATRAADLEINKATQNFIEKLASSVAETRKNDNHIVAGIVTEIKDQEITLINNAADKYTVSFIEGGLTKIYQIVGGQKKELKKSNLAKDDYVLVSGLISDKSVTANVIYIDQQYLVESGKITEVNKTDYYIRVTTPEKDSYVVDVETYTKINTVDIKTLTVERSGFSKLKEGDTVHFIYQPPVSEKEKNRIAAQRILMIPQEYFMK